MGWTNELYQIYEKFHGRTDLEPSMLPISHSVLKAQIEITLEENGTFNSASIVEKEKAETVIPVTEDSATRTSGISPMPFSDKLVYLAGNYSQYISKNDKDYPEYFRAYMKQLKQWKDSLYTHPAVHALYTYLEKSCIIQDLIEENILILDDTTGKLKSGVKISEIPQEKVLIRFIINYEEDTFTDQTWKDPTLQESFIVFNNENLKNNMSEYCQLQLDNDDLRDTAFCYATGEKLPLAHKHPRDIRFAGDSAKLICLNKNKYTYLGRFSTEDEAVCISYDVSQKAHNALKWLIRRQGKKFGELTLIIWASELENLPDIYEPISKWESEEAKGKPLNAGEIYADNVKKMILGYQKHLDVESKVMILGLDSASTGRMSISMYTELAGSKFLEYVEKWHTEVAWPRYNYKKQCTVIDSFSVYEIVNCALGTEKSDKLECDTNILNSTIVRLIPCIIEGRPVPQDIVHNLVMKASNPLAYEKEYHFKTVLETACALIRKKNLEQRRGITDMALDYQNDDRSYLYGRLLAVADMAEQDVYRKEENGMRVTNAKRYWNRFSMFPCETWKIIEQNLKPYLNKLGEYAVRYDKLINEIMDKMNTEEFSLNQALTPLYLLGYHHQVSAFYQKANKEEKQEVNYGNTSEQN